ncbi:MAG: hypothetical protein AW07_01177 [Candidatus Accumulibacter sp. SK-11]|nr:MAG: hypothetical protein AW07_01177 [Candidatus Accumulibacter sp. SK-11]
MGAAPQTDAGRVASEEMLRRQRLQAAVALRVVGHAGDDAEAEAEADVGLDDVGVDRGEHHVRLHLRQLEGLVDARATGKGGVVGDQRPARQRRERERFLVEDRVAVWGDDAMHPLVAGQHHQLRILVEGFGGDGDVGLALQRPLGDLRRVALMQRQPHLRMTVDELLDHRRQCIARLRVGGGDDQAARLATGMFLADATDVLCVAQHAPGHLEDCPARLGDRRQPLATALEDAHSEFVLEQPDLLRDSRLRGVERLGGLGHVEAAALDFDDVTQLLQLHGSVKAVWL